MPPTKQIQPLSVAEVFSKLGDGGVVEDIKTKIAEVSDAVIDTRKAGKLTITLEFKPSKKGNKLTITDTIKASVPQHDRDATTFFVAEGSLFRSNPDQLALNAQDED